jgi:hypothetical protein
MKTREEQIADLVQECFLVHQEAIIVKLILGLEVEYQEIAKLATMGEYRSDWTHKQVLDYITYET